MDSSYWQEIISAIKNALNVYDCNVDYYGPTKDGRCGYFSVTINEVVEIEEIDTCLANVISKYKLFWDDASEKGNFDLNADWDSL